MLPVVEAMMVWNANEYLAAAGGPGLKP